MRKTDRQDVKKKFQELNGILDLSLYINLSTVDVEELISWIEYQIRVFKYLEGISESTSFDAREQESCY